MDTALFPDHIPSFNAQLAEKWEDLGHLACIITLQYIGRSKLHKAKSNVTEVQNTPVCDK